jgi:2-keto-4-pentenoate hydratase/2-oxohepta-3-ene-1,7-dioic acid hydratase in catechol pathway
LSLEGAFWFNKQVSCINGPFDPVHLPRASDWLDYEAELGVVIGRRCRHVSVADAASVVAGYVALNDVSVRDWQIRSPTMTLGKSFTVMTLEPGDILATGTPSGIGGHRRRHEAAAVPQGRRRDAGGDRPHRRD